MTETVAPTGISDNQLKTLIRGGWVDDGGRMPGWERWVMVGDGNDNRQWVYPSPTSPHWVSYADDGYTYVDSLDEALALCKGDVVPLPERTTTRQEDRFARMAGSG